MEVILPCGDISFNTKTVLETWRKHFKDLLNPQADETGPHREINQDSYDNNGLNINITTPEIKAASRRLNNRKAEGIDEMSAEIMKNQNLLALIQVLFNQCFRSSGNVE